MLKVIETLVDFESPWIYISFVTMLLCFIIWKIVMRQVAKKDNGSTVLVLMIVYGAAFIIEKALFIQTARRQPCFDFGFYGSVVIPTVSFYLFLVLTVFFAIRSLRFGFLSPMSLLQFVPGMYSITIVQFMYAMALSSPTGMLLAFISFILAGWKGVSIPSGVKEKTE